MNFIEDRAMRLENQAAALRASQRTVTVELSLPLAWLVRDLVGTSRLADKVGVSLFADLERLNRAVGRRSLDKTKGHVSHWSENAIKDVVA